MKLSLHKKLVLAILISISMVILIMFFMMMWSFDRGFKAHVLSEIERRDQFLIEQLVDLYQENSGWTFIKNNPRIWFKLNSRIHFQRPHDSHRPPPPPPHEHEHRRPPPPRFFKSERYLLDKNKQDIVGNDVDITGYELSEIISQNELIGYLARKPLAKIFNPAQEKFLRHLKELFSIIALSSITVAFLIAWFLSRNLLKPIHKIKQGTSELTAGQYSNRIDIISNDELGELSQDFNVLANTLESNEQSRKQWIADISHELRTPLSILRGELESVMDGVRKMDEQRIKALHNQILHLTNLVNDLHELSLSDVGALNYEMHSNNVIEILEQCLDDMSLSAEERSITIDKSELNLEKTNVLCDSQRIYQLFNNIMMNSLAYTETPGTLKVSAEINSSNLLIHFMDSAPGVKQSELEKLFDRLYRGDSSRNRKSGGSGLGLSICSIITDAHNGTISAQQSPLGGLWITITLPIYHS